MLQPTENASCLYKEIYRQNTWEYMMKNDLVNFPSIVYKRIPNFKGADMAAKRLSELDEFKNAKVIKINPDKSQENVRLLALEANKEIIVPIPRLKSGLFLHVIPSNINNDNLKVVATRHGLQQYGKPLNVDANIKIDMVVLGAVCVSNDGYRIGKGEGFADLEFAMLMRMGAINNKTIVATTIHDSQLIDNLNGELFDKHDVPVDIIVTPTQTIFVNKKLNKPIGIFWDILTAKRVKSMQILQQLRLMDEKDGKSVILKNDETQRKKYDKRVRNKKNINLKLDNTTTTTTTNENNEIKTEVIIEKGYVKRRTPKKRQSQVHELTNDKNSSVTAKNEQNELKQKSKGKTSLHNKQTGFRSKFHIDFSLKLSNINSDVRIRDVKNALSERGVRPNDITWRGQRGFCYIHFGKLRNKNSQSYQPIQIDSIVADLQQLKIPTSSLSIKNNDNDFIVVEPAKPITRTEITDVTAI